MLKIAQPSGKIAPGTFKFIFPLAKKFRTYHLHRGRVNFQSWEVGGGGWCDPVIFKLDYFENILSDMHSKRCLQVIIVIF